MNKIPVKLCTFILVLVLSASGIGQPDIGWRVGLARLDITPTDSLWMAGYSSRTHGAQGTLHKLWIKAMALQDANGHRGVLVTADVLGFPKNLSDAIRDRCRKAYQIDRSQIILSATHTHSGPVLDRRYFVIYPLQKNVIAKIERYTRQLQEDVVALVGQALENMQPATLSSGNGVVRFQVNRRNNSSATLARQTDLNGPNDYAVPVLQVRDENGDVLALLFGYACHATVLNGYQWSGDYPGFAQLALEERFPGAAAMFFQGAGGDQNPLPRRTVPLAWQYGQELAAAVQRMTMEPRKPLAAELTMRYREINLSLAPPPDEGALRAMAQKESGSRQRWARWMLRRLERGESLPTFYPYPVQVWRIGSQAIFVLGGEVVVDYAIRLKRLFGQDIFVMAYSNDVMAYIPTARVLREGGYEGLTSQIFYGLPAAWRADIETQIIQAAIELAAEAGVSMPDARLVEE